MNRFARRVQFEAEGRVAASQRGAHEQAAAAEAAEAALRNGFRQILASLGRRNQSLLHRQLRIIDTLEQQASSPGALAELFTLDHLTTRMRRHAESLTVLSGAAPGRSWSGPVPIIDVMRAAAAEVEDYTRVTVISDAEEAVAAVAVTDMIHLLAELIENATLFSPSSTRVEIRAERVANGFAVEVTDRGLGIPADQLRELNAQLAPHRLMFGPKPATHDHCTLGGMIGNNSCGATAQAYGKTVDNVVRLEVLTCDGERFWAGPTSGRPPAEPCRGSC